MPRRPVSKAAQVLEYFRTAPLEVATEILSLSMSTLRERVAAGPTTKGLPKEPRRPKPAPAPPAEAGS